MSLSAAVDCTDADLSRVTTYMYWLAGSLSNNLNETTFLAAIINSVGSLGSTFGFVVSTEDVNYNGACAINLALFFLSLPSLIWVVFTQVTDTTHDLGFGEVHLHGSVEGLAAKGEKEKHLTPEVASL